MRLWHEDPKKFKLDPLVWGVGVVIGVMAGMVIGAWLQDAPVYLPSTPREVVTHTVTV